MVVPILGNPQGVSVRGCAGAGSTQARKLSSLERLTWPDCTGAMFGSSFLQTEESSLDLGLPRGLQSGGYKVWVWLEAFF